METLAPLSHSYEGKRETVKSKHMTYSMGWLLPGGPTATCCNHSNMGCLSGHITLCFRSLAVLYPLGMACCFTVLSVVRRILKQSDSVCLFTWYTFIQLDILLKYFRLSTLLEGTMTASYLGIEPARPALLPIILHCQSVASCHLCESCHWGCGKHIHQ